MLSEVEGMRTTDSDTRYYEEPMDIRFDGCSCDPSICHQMMMKVKDEKQTIDLVPSSMISIEVYYSMSLMLQSLLDVVHDRGDHWSRVEAGTEVWDVVERLNIRSHLTLNARVFNRYP